MPDVVRPGQRAMHPIERRGLRRPQIGTYLVHLVIVERRDAALRSHCSAEARLAGGRCCRGLQMLKPVFNPLHRCARFSGR